MDMYKQPADPKIVVTSLGRAVSEIRTFSSLTTKDYNILNPEEMDLIICVKIGYNDRFWYIAKCCVKTLFSESHGPIPPILYQKILKILI